MDTPSIWERSGESKMSANHYAFLLTSLIASGVAVSGVAAYLTLSWEYSLAMILPAFIFALFGIYIAANNDDPLVSLGGYALLCASFGVITGPVVAVYTTASVIRILFLTATVVISLGLVGALIPKVLESWGAWLCGGLLVLLAGQIFLPLVSYLGVPIGNSMTLWDWLGVLLFCGYVVFDLNQAMRIPRTVNNAIDCSIQVYLDFANLFIRLLSLYGDSNDN